MQIVDVANALDRTHRLFHSVQFHASWRALQQDVQGLAHDAETGPQNQCPDPER